MIRSKENPIHYFAKNLITVIGIILIWRGVWYLLDDLDAWLFRGHHVATAIGGILMGLLLLYLPDRSLKKLEQL